jgi:nicotinamide mononucleotide transporter
MLELFAPAFTLWGSPTTWLEIIAVVLSLAMVGCNIRVIHWAWPLAAISSVLYFLIFWNALLYAEAWLQVFFAVVAIWGWSQWLRGVRADGSVLQVSRLSRTIAIQMIAASAVLWGVTGYFLQKFTSTDVPWWDAFPVGISIVGQYLLGRKYIENWLAWIVANIVSMGLFAYKGLWLTLGLYGVFVVLSVVGWLQWQRKLRTA